MFKFLGRYLDSFRAKFRLTLTSQTLISTEQVASRNGTRRKRENGRRRTGDDRRKGGQWSSETQGNICSASDHGMSSFNEPIASWNLSHLIDGVHRYSLSSSSVCSLDPSPLLRVRSFLVHETSAAAARWWPAAGLEERGRCSPSKKLLPPNPANYACLFLPSLPLSSHFSPSLARSASLSSCSLSARVIFRWSFGHSLPPSCVHWYLLSKQEQLNGKIYSFIAVCCQMDFLSKWH